MSSSSDSSAGVVGLGWLVGGVEGASLSGDEEALVAPGLLDEDIFDFAPE